jgi:hypothetical protein
MNPYTTGTRARIQPGEMARVTLTDPFTAGAGLTALERTRAYEAEAEMTRLLKEHGIAPASVASRFAMLRHALGAALIRAGHRLATADPREASPARALADATLRPAG